MIIIQNETLNCVCRKALCFPKMGSCKSAVWIFIDFDLAHSQMYHQDIEFIELEMSLEIFGFRFHTFQLRTEPFRKGAIFWVHSCQRVWKQIYCTLVYTQALVLPPFFNMIPVGAPLCILRIISILLKQDKWYSLDGKALHVHCKGNPPDCFTKNV